MKKTYTNNDIHQKQGQELPKKLYRTISEQAKRLDDARSCARNLGELFTPNLQIKRRQFCDYCERLIFSEPSLYGKKGEELLWRKGFYEVVANAKKLKQKEYSPEDIANLLSHINGGVGFYHHFIQKLQWEFGLNLNNMVDFALQCESEKGSSPSEADLEWAKQSVHQCLVYLGDLSRYKLEFQPEAEPFMAFRYYLQAISYRPDYGMPHNQMGTLAMSKNNFLDAVYHYMRCLACKNPFEGTTNNLQGLFDKNAKFIEQLPDENQNADCIIEPTKSEKIKRFLARFLLLIDIWYFNKKVSKVYNLCHQTFKDLEECLSYQKPVSSESGESPTDLDAEDSPSYLTSDILFKVTVICLLCISKMQKHNSAHLSTIVAFTLAIYSQLLQYVIKHITESVLNYPLAEETKVVPSNGILKCFMQGGRKKSKLRRRKALKVDSEEESEGSGNENDEEYSSSDDSFGSDNDDVLAESSDDETDIIKISDESQPEEGTDPTKNNQTQEDKDESEIESKTKEDVIAKVQKMDVNDMLEIITEETALQSIKLLNDWLRHDTEVIKSCGLSTRSLLRQIVHLLNLININTNNPKIKGINLKITEVISKEGKIPLSEDVVLKGVDVLEKAHRDLDWGYLARRTASSREEAAVRIIKLISFGKFLTGVEEAGVSFDGEANVFVCAAGTREEDAKVPASIIDELELQEDSGVMGRVEPEGRNTQNGQLMKMKHMCQLWLAAEVSSLEHVTGKAALSPYLVLDADALIKYTYMVKNLVHSRKFIVVVPTAVVSALDDLKKEKLEARDAIRWLETQFQRGNRFFRAQRPQEKSPIPFIKYPKKKDKEMFDYIQIIECCHFLAEQQKGATNLVTLLIGNQNVLSNGENKELSYVGLAQSVGIAIESIIQFHSKWKKSKGKR